MRKSDLFWLCAGLLVVAASYWLGVKQVHDAEVERIQHAVMDEKNRPPEWFQDRVADDGVMVKMPSRPASTRD